MPKTTSKSVSSPPVLKQSTLSFSASKHTASNSKTPKVAKQRPSQQAVVNSDSDEIDVDDVYLSIDVDEIELSSDEEVENVDSAKPDAKQSSRPTVSKQSPTIVKVTRPSDKTQDSVTKPLELDEKDPRYRVQLNAAKAKRDHLKLIHAEGQDKFHDILRTFDLSYEYGPCVGVTRLERWERATALGLNPPVEIYDILTSRQGAKVSYAQCVFHDQV
ncbi:DNA polymerase delta subunit 4 [Mycena sanguinolenta]|uniref:DNA polymerase delta subunit 4 n=1 Tax=Mycena sanguinolenta TaxID=230812 RepID=A0A8H6ZHK1_9AGAR|nr:DNA polymerase delta subunit 4 [Mycena sanguinolenta]